MNSSRYILLCFALFALYICQDETELDKEQDTFVKLSLRSDKPFIYKYSFEPNSYGLKVENLFFFQKTEKLIRVAFGYEQAPSIRDGVIINALAIFDMTIAYDAEFDYSYLYDKAYISIFSVESNYEVELQILFQSYQAHRVDVTSRNHISSLNYSTELTSGLFIIFKFNYAGSKNDTIFLHNDNMQDNNSDTRISKLEYKFVQDFEKFSSFSDFDNSLDLELKSAGYLTVPESITTDLFFIICRIAPNWIDESEITDAMEVSLFTGYINMHINMEISELPQKKSAKELETNTYYRVSKSDQFILTITDIETELIVYFSLLFLSDTDDAQIQNSKVIISAPANNEMVTLTNNYRSSALGYFNIPSAIIIQNLNYDSYFKFSVAPKVLVSPAQLLLSPDFTFFKFKGDDTTQTFYIRVGDNKFRGLLITGQDYKITKVEYYSSSDNQISKWGARFQEKYLYKETSYLTFIPERLMKVSVTKFQQTTNKDLPALAAFRYLDHANFSNYLNESDGQDFSFQGYTIYSKQYYVLNTPLKAKAYVASFYKIQNSDYPYFRINGGKEYCPNRCTKYFDSFSYFRTQFLNLETPSGYIQSTYLDQDYLNKLRESDSSLNLYTFDYAIMVNKKNSKLTIELKNYKKWLDFKGSDVVYYGVQGVTKLIPSFNQDSLLFQPDVLNPLKAADSDGIIRLTANFDEDVKDIYLNILAYDKVSGVSKRYDIVYATYDENYVEPEKDYKLLAGIMFGILGAVLIATWTYFLACSKNNFIKPKREEVQSSLIP